MSIASVTVTMVVVMLDSKAVVQKSALCCRRGSGCGLMVPGLPTPAGAAGSLTTWATEENTARRLTGEVQLLLHSDT